MTVTVLLVDDHSIVRQGLAALIDTVGDFRVVGEAADGKQAAEMARTLMPDLIVLDLLMPNTDGVMVVRLLRTISPGSKLAVLTSSDDDELAFAAIEAGAHAFLLKSMAGAQLLDAMQRVLDDEVVIPSAITQRIVKMVRKIRQTEANPFAELSDRELDILRTLADGASNARLADTYSISVRTVKSHVGNILSKLQLNDRTEAVAFAWKNGLVKKD
jgi:NarL family two-component system response regulator LiaR